MWMNLHALPTGKSMYTIAITGDPVGTPEDLLTYDEVDVVASSRATAWEVLEAANDQLAELYASSDRVIGVSNQSDGYVIWQDPNGDLRGVQPD